ncbi:MAG: CvpA family protein [Hyphomonadaceae bacterium]|nr:CvpA family protein [Hyphomonadaceae bacterium]
MDLGLTWFDFAALFVVGLSGVMAFARGLIREVFSIVAFIGGLLAALFLNGFLAPFVEQVTPLDGFLANLAAGLAIFLVVFIGVTVIVSSLAKTAHQSTEIGSFDRAAGLAFGILRGVLFVSVLFVLPIRTYLGQNPDTQSNPFLEAVQGARTFPMYDSVAAVLEQMLPETRERVRDTFDRTQGESAPIPPAEETAPEPAPQN